MRPGLASPFPREGCQRPQVFQSAMRTNHPLNLAWHPRWIWIPSRNWPRAHVLHDICEWVPKTPPTWPTQRTASTESGERHLFQIGYAAYGQSGRIVESCSDVSLLVPRTQPLTMHPKRMCGSSCIFQLTNNYAALHQASSQDSCKLQVNMVCFLLISATDTSTAGFPGAPSKDLIKQLPIHWQYREDNMQKCQPSSVPPGPSWSSKSTRIHGQRKNNLKRIRPKLKIPLRHVQASCRFAQTNSTSSDKCSVQEKGPQDPTRYFYSPRRPKSNRHNNTSMTWLSHSKVNFVKELPCLAKSAVTLTGSSTISTPLTRFSKAAHLK